MEEVYKWMDKAERDMVAAEINLNQNLYEVSAFLSHQASEKALKALYIFKFKRLWKIHNLVELAKKVNASGNIINVCDALNPHYLATRYPLDEEYSEEKAAEALGNSRKVVKWAKATLTKEKK